MNFGKIKQTMTKEEFLNDSSLTINNGCPDEYGLENIGEFCYGKCTCKDCWKQAIEKGNVKFKGDTTEEQKVIDALKVVQNYCNGKACLDCELYSQNNEGCNIRHSLKSIAPAGWNIEELENLIKPQVVIYKVEHSKDGKLYTFVADEELPIGTMVYCDTKYGQTYGKIVDAFKGVDDGNKKCWRLE